MGMLKESQKPRWLYRFDNYKRAFLKLEEAMHLLKKSNVSDLEKEGMIQRFEYKWELSWKLPRAFLKSLLCRHKSLIVCAPLLTYFNVCCATVLNN